MENSSEKKKGILVIPTLNEEITIGQVLKKAKSKFKNEHILVIDGNSKDKTLEIVKSQGIEYLSQNGNGKGTAMIETMQYALKEGYDYICFIDGDLTYDFDDALKICKIMEENRNLAMIIGDRLRGEREKKAITSLNLIGNYLFSILISIFFFRPLYDTQSGLRAISLPFAKQYISKLNSEEFEIETELTIETIKNNGHIVNIPIKYYCRPKGSITKLSSFRIGFRILKTIFKLRFYK